MTVPSPPLSALEAVPAEVWWGYPLFSLDNLYCTWRRCRRGKRRTHNALALNARRRLRPVANGIDFLGTIVRPDYRLVRRRVVGALREWLNQAERVLQRVGIPLTPGPPPRGRGGRYPWSPALLDQLDRQLPSYWAHLARVRTHRLREALWRRYPWLDEYFTRRDGRPVRRVPARIPVVRYRGQIACFRTALPHHGLLVQQGRCWDRVPPRCPAPSPASAPRAWIVETGVRLGPLRERRVAWTERQDNGLPSPPVGEGAGVRDELAPCNPLTDHPPTLENTP